MQQTSEYRRAPSPGLSRFGRDIDSRYLDVLDGFRVCLMFIVSWFHIW